MFCMPLVFATVHRFHGGLELRLEIAGHRGKLKKVLVLLTAQLVVLRLNSSSGVPQIGLFYLLASDSQLSARSRRGWRH